MPNTTRVHYHTTENGSDQFIDLALVSEVTKPADGPDKENLAFVTMIGGSTLQRIVDFKTKEARENFIDEWLAFHREHDVLGRPL